MPGISKAIASLVPALLAACAATPLREAPGDPGWPGIERALLSGRWAAARAPLAQRVQQDLRNGNLQYLYALAEEQSASGSGSARLELAAVGYAHALRFAPGHYWALLRLGFIELQRGDWAAAQARFAEAALDQPQRWEAFYGLGTASYFRRDLPLLHLAAQRSAALAPDQPDALRLAAFADALSGAPPGAPLAQRLVVSGEEPAAAQRAELRVAQFLRDTPTLQPAPAYPDPNQGQGYAQPPPLQPDNAGNPNQVVVEVTLLLSSVLDQASRGVNLFDGLRILYGYSNVLSQVSDALGRQGTRTITSQISTPQLDYSLNLFNDSGQHYGVVARPSITAYLGRESQFFAGRTINVEVSGLNFGQLQPVDVGVRLTVTPEAIDARRVTFRLDAARSFLSQEQVGAFDNSLTTFRQAVSATAEVEFGQTLVLSALSEQVSDKAFSRVPVVGEIPGIGWLTSHSSLARRQESLLILVTPALPLNFATPQAAQQRERAAQELLDSWGERIDPQSNLPAILERLQQMRWLRPPEPGDLRLLPRGAEQWIEESVHESLALARAG